MQIQMETDLLSGIAECQAVLGIRNLQMMDGDSIVSL
jgi:hypothetical protein